MNLAFLTELFGDFAASSWRAAWLILALLILRWLVRGRIPAGIWFFAWVIVGVRLIVPFSVPVRWSPFNWAAIRAPIVEVPTVAAAPNSQSIIESIPERVTDSALVSSPRIEATAPVWPARLTIVWLAGVLALASARLVAWVRFRRSLRNVSAPDARLARIVRSESDARGRRAGVQCGETAAVHAPALYGIFRPRLLFPPGCAAQLKDEDLRLVVRHELAHWRRCDLLAQGLIRAAAVLHWYNPLAWIATRLAGVDCELACDAAVLRRENSDAKMAYGSALLKVAAIARGIPRPGPVIAIFDAKKQIAERVRMIADYRASTTRRVCGGVLLMALIAAASATRESHAADRTPAAVASPAPSSSDQVSSDAPAALVDTGSSPREKEEGLDAKRPDVQPIGLSLDLRMDLLSEALKATNRELQETFRALQTAEARLNQVKDYRAKGSDLTELPFVAENPLVRALKQRLAEQTIDYRKLGERYRQAHPKAIEAKNGIDQTQREIQRAADAVCRQIEVERDAASRSVEQGRAELERLKTDVVALDRARETRAMERNVRVPQAVTEPARSAHTIPAIPPNDDAFQVSVIGAVNQQSAVTLSLRDNPIVLDAIARAGGFAPNADRGGVRIIRSRPDGSRETTTLTEDVIMTGTDPKGRVQRADVIVVPEKPASAPPHVDVMGAVNKPGRIQMPAGRPMTIVDAISLAGGQSRLADLRKVKVNRASPSNRVLLVDVDAVLKNREPAENVLLEVGDVVFIPERIL